LRPLKTKTNPQSEAFKSNANANGAACEKLAEDLARSRLGGGEKYTKRHIERGKLLPRERIERLLDEDSYFLEICPLAGMGVGLNKPGAGVVGGIGIVSGTECMIFANESTVQGGAISELGVLKSKRLAEIAAENRLPSISLVESAGADLPNQAKVFVPGGSIFRDITRKSKARIPTICLVFGSSTAGGAYIPGMSDYTVMVKEQARVYLAGPPLVKMATGEEVDHEA